MTDCWSENPDARPDFTQIRNRLKRMKQGMKNNIKVFYLQSKILLLLTISNPKEEIRVVVYEIFYFINTENWMLYISTSVEVLRTPNPDRYLDVINYYYYYS